MSTFTPVPGAPAPGAPITPVEKKGGMGCWGWGCLILVILLLLFGGIVAIGGYFFYSKTMAYTATEATTVQTFDGGDEMYHTTEQKLTDFDHDLKNHQASTITLTADEINTLIARNPDLKLSKVRLFVTMQNDEARVEISAPTDLLTSNLLKGRFFNGDASFGLDFDPSDKSIAIKLKSLTMGNQETPKGTLPALEQQLNPTLNQMVQGEPTFKNILDNAKSIQIKNGQLVIETQ